MKSANLQIFLTLILISFTLVSCASSSVDRVVTPSAPPPATSAPTSETVSTATSLPTRTPVIVGEKIDFMTEDDLKIVGKIYRGVGDVAVILAHQRSLAGSMSSGTQKTWMYFAQLLASQGYTVLTFNHRGVGGSQGDIDMMENLVSLDVLAAADYLESEGFDRIVCIGAEMGGSACMAAALLYDFSGLGVISSTLSLGEPTKITEDNLPSLIMPKVFICAENDRYERIVAETQWLYDNSPEPKKLKFYPGTAHGTELLFSEHKDDFQNTLISFLEGIKE